MPRRERPPSMDSQMLPDVFVLPDGSARDTETDGFAARVPLLRGDTPTMTGMLSKAFWSRQSSALPGSNWSWSAALREGLRIDLGCEPSQASFCFMSPGHSSSSPDSMHSHQRNIGFGNTHSEEDVLKAFEGVTILGVPDVGARALLVLKLALALLVYGHNTVDAETLLRDVCRGLFGDRGANLELSMRSVRCSVGGSSAELLVGKRGVVFDKLVATTRLANHVATVTVDVRAASLTLDAIVDQPLPYGRLIQVFCFVGFCMTASITVFAGSYEDAKAVSLIAPFVMIMSQACQYSSLLEKLEGVLIPVFVGMITPVIWTHIFPGASCRVTTWILSSVLFFLPGVQLIYGAYETEFGSVVNGSSRLVAALMRCMFLVLGLTSGWQIFGYNTAEAYVGKAGAIASLPPSLDCPGDVPWWMGTFVYNVPLLLFLSVLFNLRVRDLFLPTLCGYLSLVVYAGLLHSHNFGLHETPPLVANFLGVFVAGNLGSFYEVRTGAPACLMVLPVVLVYAPGSGSVKSMLVSLHASMGDFDTDALFRANVWGDLVMQGVSYAFGMYVAVVIWRPLKRWSHKARGGDFDNYHSVMLQPHAVRTLSAAFAA